MGSFYKGFGCPLGVRACRGRLLIVDREHVRLPNQYAIDRGCRGHLSIRRLGLPAWATRPCLVFGPFHVSWHERPSCSPLSPRSRGRLEEGCLDHGYQTISLRWWFMVVDSDSRQVKSNGWEGSDPIREWSKRKLPLDWLFREWSKLKRIRTAGVIDDGSSYTRPAERQVFGRCLPGFRYLSFSSACGPVEKALVFPNCKRGWFRGRHEQVLKGGRLGGCHLLPPIVTVGLRHALERLLLSMLHGLLEAILQLCQMHLLLVQLPLSVVNLEERCCCVMYLRLVLP
ncbi:Hypothetical predicted protein [Prunus dulcis]|uniref:Uncharacterized protein n=1 Tax=Prunus dulcis TaxID=3755 RepID=A0A5E4FP66_PRUDU|nr:Hypothetical predicted protein [Prunus dulcis]